MLSTSFKKTAISQVLLAGLCSMPLLVNAEDEAAAAPAEAKSNELVAHEL